MESFCVGRITNLQINLENGVKPEKERILFMLIKEKNILIVAVDHGFCSLKLPHMIMENGVTKVPTEPAFKENTIFYKGSYYKVGEGRLAMKDEKTEDDDYFILTLAAIAEELKRNGLHHHNNVVIAAGVPFGRIGKEKDVFAKYLNRGFQEFQYCGEKYSCRIADVKIFPQCYAAVANRLGNMEAEQLVVDIGSKTIDVVHVRNHRPVETECFSHPQALIDCTRKIQNVIYNQFNVQLSEDKIHAVMNTGQCRGLATEIVSAVKEQLVLFAKQVEGKLKENGYNPAITPIIYCGGGAVVMKLYGKTAGEHICYMEDVKANAIGYEFIAAAMYKR